MDMRHPQHTVMIIDEVPLRRSMLAKFLADWAQSRGLGLKETDLVGLNAADAKPDLILVALSGTDCLDRLGKDLQALLPKSSAGPPVAVVTMAADSAAASWAFKIGASACLPMTLPITVFMGALDFLRAGGWYFPLDLLDQTCQPSRPVPSTREPHLPTSPVSETPNVHHTHCIVNLHNSESRTHRPEELNKVVVDLTLRQLQVLKSLRAGKTNKEIARDLDISEATVKGHIRLLMKKLGAQNRTQVVVFSEHIDSCSLSVMV